MSLLPFRPHFILMLMVMLTACQTNRTQPNQSAQKHLDLDVLYADQSLIGTTPIKPVWSKDGQQLLFLWNDEGFTFRDVWHYSVLTGQKQPLTQIVETVDHDQKAAGGHPGISEVIWLEADNGRWAYVLDGGLFFQSQSQPARRVEPNIKNIRQLKLSPDGRHLSFVGGRELWLIDLKAPTPQSAQSLLQLEQQKATISSHQWSMDSHHVVYQITDNSPLPVRDIHYDTAAGPQHDQVMRAFPGDPTAAYHLGVVDVANKRQLMFDRPNDHDYIWNYGISQDGQSVFINSSDLLVKQHTVYVFDTTEGKRSVFYHEFDPKHLRPDWQVAWAPGDDGLIILTDKDGYLHLYHQKSKTSEPVALTQGKWEIASFAVNHHDQRIYFTANESHLAERQIYSVGMTGMDIKRVSPALPGTHEFQLSPNARYLSSLFSNDQKPMELYVLDLHKDATEQITDSPAPAFAQMSWAEISYIEFPSHLDGVNLIGRLSVPAGYDGSHQLPLIVGSVYSDSVRNQYGGRTSHPTWGLDQYLVSQGYVLLNVNVRGSWGQGRAHNQGLRHGYGIIDIEDLHSGVKHLIELGYADPKRVGIWGSSYGGLMTMMSLFKKPEVYVVGIAGAPATNVAHAYPGQMWVMGEPTGADQPQRYESQSPLYHTAGLEDPLMIIHGTKDPVVLYADTIAVIEKLIAQQQPFELVTLPGTSHGWDAEGNDVRLFSFKKMVAFFDRHLKSNSTKD